MAKILLVDDDIELAAKTRTWLEKVENYTVEHSATAEDGWHLVTQFNYDLFILDWQLPGMSGVDLCKKIRALKLFTPVLFLTGMSALDNVETGLEAGADDYLKKPFELRELSARCRALLRRTAPMVQTVVSGTETVLHVDKRLLCKGALEVKLTKLETGFIDFLMHHPDRSFSAAEILKAVYPSDKESSDEAVRAMVRALRVKLGAHPELRELVVTVPGAGYKLGSKNLTPT